MTLVSPSSSLLYSSAQGLVYLAPVGEVYFLWSVYRYLPWSMNNTDLCGCSARVGVSRAPDIESSACSLLSD